MNKFKVGDDVWFFTFPEDGCGGFDVSSIELLCDHEINATRLSCGYINYCYHSKQEAIEAMIARLKEL